MKSKTISLFLLLFFALMALPGSGRAEEVAVIPIRFRPAADVLPVVKNLLSQQGRATVDESTNSLVLVDNVTSIRRIRTFLEQYDKPLKQVRISVRFEETGSGAERGISAEGSRSGNGWRVSPGKKDQDDLNIHIRDRNSRRQQDSQYTIHVVSGSRAYLVVGKKIPYRERWVSLCRRYAGYVSSVGVQRIETGMEVLPVIVGNHANIDIIPRISHESPGGRNIIRFAEAATRLHAPLGQWVGIGGTNKKSNEVMTAIFESGARRQNSSLSMHLMAEAY